jgi:hypothetical protein
MRPWGVNNKDARDSGEVEEKLQAKERPQKKPAFQHLHLGLQKREKHASVF